MKDAWNSILETWLPSKWPRLIMGLAISLSLIILIPPRYLQIAGLPLNQEEISIARTVGIPWLLLFSLALTHFLILQERKAFENLKNWKFHKIITLDVGDYYELKNGEKSFLKITVNKVSKEKVPPFYFYHPESEANDVECDTATLTFYPSFIYAGRCVKKIENPSSISEESFILPNKTHGNEEDHSVYFFNVTNSRKGERFFRCHIEHINLISNHVKLIL
jgi:hypothetical protein